MKRPIFHLGLYKDLLKGILGVRLNHILHFLARNLPGNDTVRPALHRWRGVKIGKDVLIGQDVQIEEDFPSHIEIQDGARIATRCTLIGHAKGFGKLVVGKDAAIGAGSIIICGSGKTLTIGEGAVIAAGSTVLNDVPPFALVGPPRVKMYGTVAIPYHKAQTIDEFRRAVRGARVVVEAEKDSTPSGPPGCPS